MRIRTGLMIAGLLALAGSASAQTPVERGKYLVNTILTCQNCHTPKGERGAPIYERDLSNGLTFDEPPFKVTASNITQDKETGIGNWSDADIKKALQKGERPNGVKLAAIMPFDFYEIFTPGDLNAVVAYLRTVKPVKQETPAPIYRIALPRHIPPGAEKPFSEADMADKVKKGFYLVTIGHCMECHTPMGPRGREFASAYGKGGFDFKARGASRRHATSPRTRRRASARGAMPRSSARLPKARAGTARLSSRRWATSSTRT